MTTEEKLDRLTTIVDSLAASVVHHDNQIEAHDRQIEAHDRQIEAHDRQIEALISIGEQHDRRMREIAETVAETSRAVANLERQWQAYINTLPRQ